MISGFVELYLCVTLFLTPLLDIFWTLCHVLSPSMFREGRILYLLEYYRRIWFLVQR